MSGIGAYDELVSLIYDCVLDETAWARLLERLALATGRRDGTLVFLGHDASALPRVGSASLCSVEQQMAYNSYYSAFDPTAGYMRQRAVGHWYHDTQEFGEDRMARDSFYQEFSRAYGQRSTSCVKLYEHDGGGAYLSLLTALDAPLPSDEQQMLLQRLSAHLMQAARMSEHMQQLKLGVAHRDLLLEQSETPLWLVDAEGRSVFCNAAAERRVLDNAFPLRVRQGRLKAHELPTLPALLRDACGRAGPPRAGWLRLPGLIGELLVTPLKADSHFNLIQQRPLALLALLENRPRLALLAELFELTPAECRLAEMLVQGGNPERCAQLLDVSITTVRSQLRSLFGKTGTQRQAELVGLLTRLSRN